MSDGTSGCNAKRRRCRAALFAVACSVLLAATASGQVVISQIYGGGNNTSAAYRDDFVELFNPGCVAVDLTGWSIQQASSTGTSWSRTNLPVNASIAPGGYYLVQFTRYATGTATGAALPVAPDAFAAASGSTGLSSIDMGGTTGKIALVRNQTTLPAATCPNATFANGVVDMVTYGTGGSACEGTVITTLSGNGISIARKLNGCQDTNNNANDFTAATATLQPPRNSASALNACASTLQDGACSFVNGTCQVMTPADCTTAGGSYANCVACPPRGACCAATGVCTLAFANECALGGGSFAGDNTKCYNVTTGSAFNDITSLPGVLTGPTGDDSALSAFTLPFTFVYFGVSKTQIWYNTNGLVGFGGSNSTAFADVTFPNTATPNDVFAPVWDDFNVDASANTKHIVIGSPGSRQFIVQWNNVLERNTATLRYTFQAVVEENTNAIEFRYQTYSAPPFGGDFNSGIENGAGTVGQWFDPRSIVAGASYRLTPVCSGPTGACCVGTSCSILSQVSCTNAGGTYQGNNSVCSPNPCTPPGACCLAGVCSVNTVAGCTGAGGYFYGEGTNCSTNICVGACCLPSGVCSVTNGSGVAQSSACTSQGGTYQGDGASCTPNPCPPAGSCCVDGNCSQLIQAACAGVWTQGAPCSLPGPIHTYSNGSNLPLVIPDNTAATTFVNSTITVPDSINVYDLDVSLTIPNHTFIGDLTIRLSKDAGTPIVLWGKACSGNDNMTATFDDEGVTVTCSPGGPFGNIKTSGTGAGLLSGFDGLSAAGTWKLEISDSGSGDTGTLQNWSLIITEANNVCAIGACCFGDGSCTPNVSASTCSSQGGSFQGNGSSCSPNPCPQPQACCFADGHCTFVLATACTTAGGTPNGAGTSCTPNPCPQPEACCFADGSCTFVLSGACAGAGGSAQGVGTNCSPNACPQPQACCLPDFSCLIALPAVCQNLNGAPQGNGTVCPVTDSPRSYERQPALVLPDSTTVSDAMVVTDNFGIADLDVAINITHTYISDQTIKLTHGSTIVTLLSGDCSSNDNVDAIVDDEAPNLVCGTNITGSYNPNSATTGQMLSAFDGANINGTWTLSLTDSASGDTGVLNRWALIATPFACSVPTRACCFGDGSCQNLTPTDCQTAGGASGAVGSGCSPNPCPQPEACCFADGNCTYVLATACTTAGGIPHGAGSSCTPNPCPQPEACCFNDGSCTTVLAGACATAGGSAQGAGSSCTPNPCPQPQACCMANGACQNLPALPCANAGGTALGDGTSCPTASDGFDFDVHVGILDLSTVTDTQNVGDEGVIADLDVDVNISHTYQGDIVLKLTSPAGTTVTLISGQGSGNDNFGNPNSGAEFIFDDEAAAAYTTSVGVANPTGHWKPASSLSAFDGQSITGDWTLSIEDTANGDTGFVNHWSLHVVRSICVGACCGADGSCSITTAAGCTGSFQGVGSSCAPNPCPQPTVACCFADGHCEELTATACQTAGGAAGASGSNCSPNLCPQLEACCYADGSCQVMLPANCINTGGNTPGFSSCVPNPCEQPNVACCFADGSCVTARATDCQNSGGTPQGYGSSCSPNPCPQPGIACCFADGHCEELTSGACQSAGGSSQGYPSSCTPNPCPEPTVACCFPDGACLEFTAASCSGQGGSPQPAGSSCTPNPCPLPPVACCFPDGSCQDLTPTECQNVGGSAQPVGSHCYQNICPQPEVACCFADGHCQMVVSAGCVILGGIPQPYGSTCTPNPCVQPAQACCFADGHCDDLTATDCQAAGGSPQGYPSYCASTSCPQPDVACCYNDGTCSMLNASACVNNAGVPQPYGSSCTPNPCPQPEVACCYDDGHCLDMTAAACSSSGGIPGAVGSHCGPVNPCPQPLVACCFPDGSCQMLTNGACNAAFGHPHGIGSTCTPNTCLDPNLLCAGTLVGDANCDGRVNNFDIDYFVYAIVNSPTMGPGPDVPPPPPAEWLDQGGTADCWAKRRCWGDINCDGALNNFDIDPFVACILYTPAPGNGCPSCFAEACCYPGGFCVNLLPAACTYTAGTPQGAGTTCATVTCP